MTRFRGRFLGIAILTTGPVMASWQAEAPLTIAGAGTVTIGVPAALHRESAGGLDLDLLGPEGGPRPFELYLREDRGPAVVDVQPKSVRMVGKSFIWEAVVPARERIRATAVEFAVSSGDYMGRVHIEGRLNGRWVELARDAAVTAAAEIEMSRVQVEPAVYDAWRLTFTAWGKRPIPVDRISVVGTRTGADAVERPLSLAAAFTRTTGGAWLEVVLPGSGLEVVAVDITPATRFAGSWSVERETVRAGTREFVSVATGTEAAVGRDLTVRMPVGRRWPGRAMRIRLMAGHDHLGVIPRLIVRVRLPQLAFVAEAPGAYRLVAGGGRDARVQDIREFRPEAAPATVATIGAVIRNTRWKPEDLVVQYGLGGARFAPSGYRWKSALRVDSPGFRRIALHERASLEGNPAGLRLVRNGMQVPFLLDEGEIRAVQIPLEERFDGATNTTVWHLALPRASSRWLGLRLHAEGIFLRTVEVTADTPVPADQPVLARLNWTHAGAGPTTLDLPVIGLRPGESKLRVRIAHGENRPVKIVSAEVFYRAPGLSFLADATDGYELYGGHPEAGAVRWDLDLVAGRLAGELPGPAAVAEPVEVSGAGAWAALTRPFGEARWGLYVVLGVLTAALVAIIVRLFPASSARRPRK